MKINKTKGKLPFIRSMAPGNVPHDQEVFNKSVNFNSTADASSSASSSGECCAESLDFDLELPDVEMEPITQPEIDPQIPESNEDSCIASMLTSAICEMWQSLDAYTNMVNECKQSGYDEVAEVLKTIVSERTTQIGKLQKSLESILPTIQLIDQGEANAELTLNEELETIDDEQKDTLEDALGVTLSLTQENYIYDKWREFYDNPQDYPELVDIIKNKMTSDGVFVESVFNRKLDESMKFKDFNKENITKQIKSINDIEMEDVVEGTEKHYDAYDAAMKERSKELDKDGGILGAKKQPVPDKVTYPKVKLEEKYMSSDEFDKYWDEDQVKPENEREFPPKYTQAEIDKNPKNKDKNDKYLQQVKDDARKELVDSDLDLAYRYWFWLNVSDNVMKQLGVNTAVYDKIMNDKSLTFEDKDKKLNKFREDVNNKFSEKFGLSCNTANRGATGGWDLEICSDDEDKLKQFMNDNGINGQIHKMHDISKSERADTEKIVKDLRYMIQAELSTDAGDGYNELIFPQGKDAEYPPQERYKSELSSMPTRDFTSMNYELGVTGDGYIVHVDSPERLEFAKKVADAYKKFGLITKEYEPEPWRRTPNERYKMEFIIPEWTDGIDIASKAAKKRYEGLDDATEAMKEFAGIKDEPEYQEDPVNKNNYKDKSIFKN